MKEHIWAGLDEVGRGSIAGPVVTGCALFSLSISSSLKVCKRNNCNEFMVKGDGIRITDSKKMSPKEREIAAQWIQKNAIGVGIGKSSVTKINKIGIVPATNEAFRKSVRAVQRNLLTPIDLVLVDAFFISRLPGIKAYQQRAIVHGDATEFVISAASIVAKVYRDTFMEKLAHKQGFEVYQWDRNKGYGTKDHREAIQKYGTTTHHRTLFVRKIIGEHK